MTGANSDADSAGRQNAASGGLVDLGALSPLRSSQNHALYDHPHYPGILLKVRIDQVENGHGPARPATLRYGNLRQWNREANEYLAALNRRVPEITRLAQFMGYAPTSHGPALMVEKLTGADGQLAPTATQLIRAMPQGGPERRAIHEEVMELIDDLERARIIVGDLYFDNIVRAEERGGRLTVIDGVGERVLFPLTLYSDWAFRRSIARRRERLSKSILPNG